ncbi:D-alanyl-D-alanine carboxypeptidase/D-alanyl-D-alanine endopeptidase [Trichothermofontia sp.]
MSARSRRLFTGASRRLFTGQSPRPALGLAIFSSLSLGFTQPSQAATPTSLCPRDLEAAIAAITDRPEFTRSRWGILVQSLATATEPPHTLYQRDAEHYFIPASNAKLLSTAAALHRLGPQFRIRTTVYQVPNPDATVLQIVGRADPSLTEAGLTSLAQQLKRAGMRQIDRLILDESYLGGTFVNPNWEWEDIQAGYGAPLNSLIVNQNAIPLQLVPQRLGEPLGIVWEDAIAAQTWQVENRSLTVAPGAPEFVKVGRDLSRPLAKIAGHLRVGSEPEPVAIAVVDPIEHFGQRWQPILQAQGIGVKEIAVTTTPMPSGAIARATWQSAPLAELLQETNQYSNNFYAEALLAILGRMSTPVAADRSPTEAGLAVMATTLSQLGINHQGYALADGSGLSRHNLATPAVLVQTLQTLARSPHAVTYRDSLAVMGETGTLRRRLASATLPPIQAKSGAMQGVASLSGYLERPDASPLVFSILINQSTAAHGTLTQTIDEIVQVLTRLRSCPETNQGLGNASFKAARADR